MLKCYVRGDPPAVFPKKRSVLLAAVVLLVCCCLVVPAVAAENITELLELEDTSAGVYELTKDITIQASELNALTDRDFSGSLDGGGHTITITGDEPAVSLFENVTGSGDGIRNLKIIFEGSVLGAPFAKNITNTPGQVLSLTDISVTVNGNVLPATHDYLKYVGKGLTGSGSYGNWDIHFGGEPKHLATGFAWYILGATVQNVSVDIKGDIGTSEKQNQDTTSTGFAYFALRGTDTTLDPSKITYHDISISVGGSIQSKVSDGYSGAYGFAVGISDNSMMRGLYLGEVENVSISVTKDISAYTDYGNSNAFGFVRVAQGYIHDCSVKVTNNISSFSLEKNTSRAYASNAGNYTYAIGFMYQMYGNIGQRYNVTHNTVTAGNIVAESLSASSGSSLSSGFTIYFVAANNRQEGLSLQENQVIITDSVHAAANGYSAGAVGFIWKIARSSSLSTQVLFTKNTVQVGNNISATSQSNYADATGFCYLCQQKISDCSVTVGDSISAESGTQALASGFVVRQVVDIPENSIIEDCSVHVSKDILAKGLPDGQGIASGFLSLIEFTSTSHQSFILKNTVEVQGDIVTEGGNNYAGFVAHLIGGDISPGNSPDVTTVEGNVFIGKENLIEIRDEDKESYPHNYTYFTSFLTTLSTSSQYSVQPPLTDRVGNTDPSQNIVQFTRDDGVVYTSPVTLAAVAGDTYPDLWKVNYLQSFTITATTGPNGSITPSGGVSVAAGSDQTFTFMPDDGYTVAEVRVDDEVVAPSSSYTFTNVQADHTIHVTFTQKPTPPVPIPPSGGGSSDGNMDNAFRVLFNDGSTTLFVVTDLSYGDKLTKPEDPVKDGYTFAGWHKDAACTQAWDFADGIAGDMTLYAKWTPVQTVTPTVTPTATVSVTPTVTAEPTGLPTTTPTVQPTGEDDGGKPAGSVLPLIGGILILILAVLLLLFLLLRHTVTFLIPTGGEITEYRIKVWHGRYIDPADLPELLRTAAWYRDPARQERWDFNEDRVTKSIELYLG